MHLRAIIFDLDGTLIDSYMDIGIHLNKTLRDFNKPEVDIQEVKHMIGGGARELIKRFFPDGLLEQALETFRKYYIAQPVIHTKPFDGIVELLEYAKKKDIRLAVVTNKMESLSRLILERLDLIKYFSLLVGGDTYPEKKPSPLPIIEALKTLSVSPSESLMVGDTEADLKAGRLSGLKRGLANWGYVKVIEEVPDYIFQSPLDIKELINAQKL